jgi:hypothetical protein
MASARVRAYKIAQRRRSLRNMGIDQVFSEKEKTWSIPIFPYTGNTQVQLPAIILMYYCL